MKKVLLLTMMLVSIFGFSQDWTKSQRQGFYELAKNDFVLNKGLTQDQQKAISLCFMESVTKEYTPADYNNKIDIELETIHNSILDRCAKKMGISLTKEKEVAKEPESKKMDISFANVIGNWKDDSYGNTLYLQSNSKYILTAGENISKGKWRVEGSYLVLSWIDGKYTVLALTSTTMTLNKGNKVYHLTKQ